MRRGVGHRQPVDQGICQSYEPPFQKDCLTDLADGGAATTTCEPGDGTTQNPDWTFIINLICGAGGWECDAVRTPGLRRSSSGQGRHREVDGQARPSRGEKLTVERRRRREATQQHGLIARR